MKRINRKRMNIHIMHDYIFINSFLEKYLQSHMESNNKFFVIRKYSNEKLIKIKSPLVVPIVLNKSTMKKIISETRNIDYIYFHNFPPNIYSLLQVIPKNIKINWIFHGTEIYKYLLTTKIMDDHSLSVYAEIYNKRKILRLFPDSCKKYFWLFYEKLKLIFFKRVLKRIDFFYHWNKLDYFYIKNKFTEFNAQFVYFGYNSNWKKVLLAKKNLPNKTLFEKESHEFPQKIMIGHCSTITLNHLSVLNHLSKFDNRNFQIICPLSYGNKNYKNFIIKYAKEKSLENFYPIETFIPYEEYKKIISGVSILVMNNIRSQGAGNIHIALAEGKKVYMNTENTHYQMLIKMGFYVYSMQEFFSSSIEKIFIPLKEDYAAINQDKLRDFLDQINARYLQIP
jgi:hypothetical protein